MIFSKKRSKELEDIRDAIDDENKQHPDMHKPQVPNQPVHHEMEPHPELPPHKHDDQGAPLFIKVDKYREILTGVQEMKLFVSSVKQLFNVLHEVESVRNDALNVLRATIQRLDRSIAEIDVGLLRPKGVSMDLDGGEDEAHHIESSLVDLQSQLKNLREELQVLK